MSPAFNPRRNARKRNPPASQRRALEFLAGCPAEGCPEALLIANGFTVELLIELVQAGLTGVTPERMIAGGETIEIARVWITEAGRRELAG